MKQNVRISCLLFATGALSVAAGALYLFNVFGPSEREVAMWGLIESLAGMLVMLSPLLIRAMAKKVWPVQGLLVANLLMQILPAILWFQFDGRGISDGMPPSPFIASWAYALPHIVIALMCVACFASMIPRTRVEQESI